MTEPARARGGVNGAWKTKTVPTLLTDRVAIGGETPYGYLRHMGFDAIIDLRETTPQRGPEDLRAFRLFHAPLDDGVAPTPAQLASICRTIDSYRSSFFFVHCYEGVGRAVTAGAAHLMWERAWSARQALDRILDLRPAANPTRAQTNALDEFGRALADPGKRASLRSQAIPLIPYQVGAKRTVALSDPDEGSPRVRERTSG